MGASSRDYMKRTDEEIERAERFGSDEDEGGIPLWEETADRLRVRLHKFARECPLTSVQELGMLADCATAIQLFHIRGKQLDHEDEQTEAPDKPQPIELVDADE